MVSACTMYCNICMFTLNRLNMPRLRVCNMARPNCLYASTCHFLTSYALQRRPSLRSSGSDAHLSNRAGSSPSQCGYAMPFQMSWRSCRVARGFGFVAMYRWSDFISVYDWLSMLLSLLFSMFCTLHIVVLVPL